MGPTPCIYTCAAGMAAQPVIVVTAKDLTEDDRNRLAGSVEKVLEKNACTREQLLERVSEAVAACHINT